MRKPTESECRLLQLAKGLSVGLHDEFYEAAKEIIQETVSELDLDDSGTSLMGWRVWEELKQRSERKEDCPV